MAESSEVQALEKISTEVSESQVKITLSSQCIKAQAFLVDKLKKQTERQKEICGFISSSNLKLQTEIKQAELEIKSLITAHETIKTSNVELKKELLLAKERKLEIEERIANGEKKYEDLWLQSKKRYESIPFVQKLLAATNKTQTIKEKISALENQSRTLTKEYEDKKELLVKSDRERIVKLAEYLVHDLPNSFKILQEKSMAINEISSEIEEILKDRETGLMKTKVILPTKPKEVAFEEVRCERPVEDGWVNIYQNNERDLLMMPRLQFINSDFEDISAKLDEIKIKKTDVEINISSKRLDCMESDSEISSKRPKKDDEFSIFFNNHTMGDTDDKKADNFSRKKLINILEDVKLDRSDTYNIVSKIQVNNLKGVDMIGNDIKDDKAKEPEKPKDTEIIEEIDLTTNKSDNNILIPPTQFLDLTQEKIFNNSPRQVEVIVHMSMSEQSTGKLSQPIKNSQEEANKKRVSFDLPLSTQEMTNKMSEDDKKETQVEENYANETIDSQVNISLTSDESYTKIKDMILKKHNLDLSPQFVYAKNKTLQMDSERIVTSKFFQPHNSNIFENDENKIRDVTDIVKSFKESDNGEKPIELEAGKLSDVAIENMDMDNVIVSSPKPNPTSKERSVTGLLFNHGTQGIPDSLNVSISTTGFEEGDADFPHCIDSSLLLSPKADISMQTGGDGVDVASQEVPNFLSGLRKTGLSFFGQSAPTEAKPDTSGPTHGNNFNFNFGGDEKKARGGLFSMFH